MILRLLLLAPLCTWLTTELDLGTIGENDGPREGEFRYVNTGTEPLLVDRIKPSCGCTAVTVMSDPTAPGDTASVRLTYNPAGRPGRFDKSVRVWMTGEEEPQVLRVKGLVIPSEETLQAAYPHGEGTVRYSTGLIDAGEVTRGKSRHFFVTAYNTSTTEPHTLSLSCSDPRILVSDTPVTVPPGESETLVIQAIVPRNDKPGKVTWTVEVTDSAADRARDAITVGGNITD